VIMPCRGPGGVAAVRPAARLSGPALSLPAVSLPVVSLPVVSLPVVSLSGRSAAAA
jgi:hypothetical protein